MKVILIILSLVILQGCATKQKMDYFARSNQTLSAKINSPHRMTSLVKDNRPYILNSDKKSSFIGLSRVYGAPVSAYAPNDMPFSEVFSQQLNSVLIGLSQKSHFATGLKQKQSLVGFSSKMPNIERLLTFDVREWKFDANAGWGSTSFIYDVTLEVMDADLEKLSETTVKGRSVVKGNQFQDNYANLIEELLSDQSVIQSLNKQ